MKRYLNLHFFLLLLSLEISCLPLSCGQAWAQSNNYKPAPNKMIINLEASTQKFELPVKDVKTRVNNDLTYYWYKSNQVLQTKGGYDGKLLHGAYAEFYLNNNLKEKGLYKKGLKSGEWKSWHENGQLKEIIKFRNGLNHGKFLAYNEKGELLLLANYRKGKLHGQTVSYENGKVLASHKYRKGIELLPKPAKIKEEKKKKFSWKFWKKGKAAQDEKPIEKQPDNKPGEKEKAKEKKETEKEKKLPSKEEKEPGKEKEPEKKNNLKDSKTSNG